MKAGGGDLRLDGGRIDATSGKSLFERNLFYQPVEGSRHRRLELVFELNLGGCRIPANQQFEVAGAHLVLT